MPSPTATTNTNLAFRVAEFETLTEGLDYAARGETGCTFFSPRGEIETAFTYGDIRDRAISLAQSFERAGFRRGSRLAIIAEISPDFLIFFFACQYAGLIPVPLPLAIHLGGRDAYVDRLRRMIQEADAQAAVGPSDLLPYLREAAGSSRMVGTPEDFYDLPAGGGDLRPFQKHEPCYIQYSSGSTSSPRGVFVSQRSITSNARGIAQDGLRLREGDRSVSWLPLYHDMGLVGFCLTPTLSQVSIDYLSTTSFARRPLVWLKVITDHGGTISFSPTFGYDLCLRRGLNGSAKTLDLSRWRVAGIGGEMVRADILERFADTFGVTGFSRRAFVPSYGLAESTLAVTCAALDQGAETETIDQDELALSGRAVPIKANGAVPNEHTRSFVVCGSPLPGHEVEVRNERNVKLLDHQVGRVMVKGPSVMEGYYRNPKATEMVMTADGWLDTGDLGYTTGGRLVITGRRKDLIILNGRNIWPQDIEWAVEKLENVRGSDVACFAVIDANGSEEMVVIIQCRLADAEAREKLRKDVVATVHKKCGADCTVVMVPPRTLKFTSSGKLSRAAVKSDYVSGDIIDLASQPKRAMQPMAEVVQLSAAAK